MLILLTVSALLLVLFSPFIGYVYILSVGGALLYRNRQQANIFYVSIASGIVIILLSRMIGYLELADIVIGVLLVAFVFLSSLKKTGDYVAAFVSAGMIQVCYGFLRKIIFGTIYEERISAFFLGYSEYFDGQVTALGEVGLQAAEVMGTVKTVMIDYQVAIWGLTMLIAMYVAMVFLSKKLDLEWNHHKIRFPFAFAYLLIIALILSVYPATRLTGLNGLVIMLVFFLIQGLSIVDFIAKNYFKKSRFIMISTLILLIINVFFAIMIAILGLLDYWLDIRKINQ